LYCGCVIEVPPNASSSMASMAAFARSSASRASWCGPSKRVCISRRPSASLMRPLTMRADRRPRNGTEEGAGIGVAAGETGIDFARTRGRNPAPDRRSGGGDVRTRPEEHDLLLELDAEPRAHARLHDLRQLEHVLRGRVAGVDEDVRVLGEHERVTHAQPAA